IVRIRLPLRLEGKGPARDREEFLAWSWREFADHGLQGVHEGSVFEGDPEVSPPEGTWEVDSGIADQSRDWIGKTAETDAELYFDSESAARRASDRIHALYPSLNPLIVEQKPEDWNARWRESFTG